MRACRVCGSTAVTPATLEETMFGSREPFEYLECTACGSISIADVPTDLGRYYPTTYLSFNAREYKPRFGHLARRLAIFTFLKAPAPLLKRLPARLSWWRGMGEARVRYSTRVLDVGCGDGALLKALARSGFKDVHGVDPFVAHSSAQPHITITKGELSDLNGEYGFILLSHSLEHMPDPSAALREVARLCAPGGHVLICLPVVNRTYTDYGVDWIGLDPPRHMFIPTMSGLTALIGSVPGLHLIDTWYDATAPEFFNSELARRRVANYDRSTGRLTAPASYFDKAQMSGWSRKARDYNKRGEAGTAAFLIERQ